MTCEIFDLCGGCIYRNKQYEEYCHDKFENFKKIWYNESKNEGAKHEKNIFFNYFFIFCDNIGLL